MSYQIIDDGINLWDKAFGSWKENLKNRASQILIPHFVIRADACRLERDLDRRPRRIFGDHYFPHRSESAAHLVHDEMPCDEIGERMFGIKIIFGCMVYVRSCDDLAYPELLQIGGIVPEKIFLKYLFALPMGDGRHL